MTTKVNIHSFLMLSFLSMTLFTSGSRVEVEIPPAGSPHTFQDETNLIQKKVQIEAALDGSGEDQEALESNVKKDIAVQLMAMEAWSGNGDKCDALIKRLDTLSAQDLTTKVGNDPLFPPTMVSIATGSGSCGDSAAGISDDCTKYNEWHKLQDYNCQDLPGAKSGKKWSDGWDSCAEYTKWSNFCDDYGATDYNGEGAANDKCCACVGGNKNMPLKVVGPSGIQFEDVGQGKLGDCYFLAALASIAYAQPQVLEDLFVDKGLWAQNIFKTKWLLNGQESTVAVDNMIPGSSKKLFFVDKSSTGEFWPVILEKAWGKAYGSFKKVEGGWWSQAVGALTRAPVVNLNHDKTTIDEIWKVLTWGTQLKLPMGCGTNSKRQAKKYGLAEGHQYSALEAWEKDGKKYVKCFNPWNSDHYKGAVKNEDKGDGVFTMLLEEYHAAFVDTEYAYLMPGYKVSSTTIPAGKSRSVKSIQVSSSGTFYVSVTWPGKRMVEPCDSPRPAVTLAVSKELSVGDHVQAKYQDHLEWYSAVIAKDNGDGTFTLDWDDGDTKDRVKPPELIKPLKGSAPKKPSFGTTLNAANTANVKIASGPGSYDILAGAFFSKNAWLDSVHLSVYAAEEVQFATSTKSETDAAKAMLRFTTSRFGGCECMKDWGYKGKWTTSFCFNPDNSATDWCFTVKDMGCPKSWGYCEPI
mmetsp:Transcript_102916/g.178568  ORF Transcript_102916/g.178568 Transcript_102916/m.178568 type:complete len:691 (+) Transcript_102916:84-2156(+)